MEDMNSLPLHLCRVDKSSAIINRTYILLQSAALTALIYYRASSLFRIKTTHLLPWLLVFSSELILSFIWFLGIGYRWRPVKRTVFPERLPEDEALPAIDVFICTADPSKEPTVEVMNTVISAMALDYPPEKIHVYVSDDGGTPVTLLGMKEAWKFAALWIPFCRRHEIKTRCPEAYFSESCGGHSSTGTEFTSDEKKVKVGAGSNISYQTFPTSYISKNASKITVMSMIVVLVSGGFDFLVLFSRVNYVFISLQ